MKRRDLVESSVKIGKTDKRKSVAQRKLKLELVKNEDRTRFISSPHRHECCSWSCDSGM